jgi:hypothetical protein
MIVKIHRGGMPEASECENNGLISLQDNVLARPQLDNCDTVCLSSN